MSVCVYGPGMVGSFLGALAGAERVVCGPSGRIRASTAQIQDRRYTWSPQSCVVPDPNDLLLICTRVHTSVPIAEEASSLFVHNGLHDKQMAALCFFAVDVCEERVRLTGSQNRIVLPTLPEQWAPVIQAWQQAGLHVEQVANTQTAMWEKLILNATVGPLCLATGLSMSAVWESYQADVMAATAEGLRIAETHDVICDQHLLHRASTFFSDVGAHVPSVVRNHGEIDATLGALLRAAQHACCACPALERIAEKLSRAGVVA